MASNQAASLDISGRRGNCDPRLGIWFPTIRAGTGADVFTERLAKALSQRGIRAGITWLPHRAEYLPWSVAIPRPPEWATVTHINSWLHRRFIPANLPLVVTLHHCVHTQSVNARKELIRPLYHRFWIKSLEAYNIRHACKITAVSQHSANQFNSVFGRNDIQVLYNWVDLDVFSPDSRIHPHQPFRLLFIGKPSLRKGADLLSAIMTILGPDFELRYTGTPGDIGVADVPSNMVAIGRLADEAAVADAYRNADALLFPTRLEGFGLVALEAQACGIPVIATKGSSMPEIVKDGETGILCEADDVDAFVSAARGLRQHRRQWKAMREASRKHAITLSNEKSAIDAYASLYRGIQPQP